LQYIANNLPDAFTNYKGVTKSLISARNITEIVEIPQKTTQAPKQKKRGGVWLQCRKKLLASNHGNRRINLQRQ
jgi:hypothetical protein